jgi:hypothetical protein
MGLNGGIVAMDTDETVREADIKRLNPLREDQANRCRLGLLQTSVVDPDLNPRIFMFLGVLDLAPYPGSGIICTDPDSDPDPFINKQKKLEKP